MGKVQQSRRGARTRLVCAIAVLWLAGACGTGRTAQWENVGPPPAPAAVPRASAPPAAVDHLANAAAAWDKRADKAALAEAIAHFEKHLAGKPDDGEAWARLARAYYVMADGHLRGLGPKDAQYLGTLEKGTSAGERSLLALSPAFKARVQAGEKVEDAIQVVGQEGLPGMYWYAVNLGKWSRAKGLAALLGNKDRVKGVMTRALALDETFFHGAPHRYFGAYWALLPVGRDLDKSREHFDKSLAIAPNYAGTKVLMAENYAVKKQDRALFLRLLDEVLTMPDDAIADLVAETRFEKDKARELKAKVDELF